jgi:predicted amidohydrolase
LRKVNIGLVQMKMARDPNRNLEKAAAMVTQAADQGAQVVCLPELFDSLYFPQHRESEILPTAIPSSATERLSEVARSNEVVLIGGSLFERSGSRVYNTSFIFDDEGEMVGSYRKVHLPQDPGFYERDYFCAGNRYRVFNTRYGRIGVLICFDQWYPEPVRILKLMGADILFYPTAIGTLRGIDQVEGNWQSAWVGVQRGHAISNSIVVAAVNRVGLEGDLSFWGGSFVCDQFGKAIAQADSRERVLTATCDLDLAKQIEEGWGFLRNRRPDTYAKLVK